MRRRAIIFFLLAFVISTAACFAKDMYPSKLENGKLILVDAQMGVGMYADRSSVHVKECNPPNYEISIDVIPLTFSEEYYQSHGTYIGSPCEIGERNNHVFRYNSAKKTVSYNDNGEWKTWDINGEYSHADGDPQIPYTAETAFATAFQKKFYGNTKKNDKSKVIDNKFYKILGIKR